MVCPGRLAPVSGFLAWEVFAPQQWHLGSVLGLLTVSRGLAALWGCEVDTEPYRYQRPHREDLSPFFFFVRSIASS